MNGTRYLCGFILLGWATSLAVGAAIEPFMGSPWPGSALQVLSWLGEWALAAIIAAAGIWIWPKPSR